MDNRESVQVDSGNLFFTRYGRMAAEASDIGLAVGEWPEQIAVKRPVSQEVFTRRGPAELGVLYVSDRGNELEVIND